MATAIANLQFYNHILQSSLISILWQMRTNNQNKQTHTQKKNEIYKAFRLFLFLFFSSLNYAYGGKELHLLNQCQFYALFSGSALKCAFHTNQEIDLIHVCILQRM